MEDRRWEMGIRSAFGFCVATMLGLGNAEPAYAEHFGVAGAHLSRSSESEGGTSNFEVRMHRTRLTMRLEQAK